MRWPRWRRARCLVRTNGADADGEIVWSWPPDAEAKFAGVTNAANDGGKKARSPGRVRISRKTVAQGMPDDSAEPVVPSPCFFTARGPWVRPSPGIPCALLVSEGRSFRKARARSRRGNADPCPHQLSTGRIRSRVVRVAVLAVPNQGWGLGRCGVPMSKPLRKHTERCKSPNLIQVAG